MSDDFGFLNGIGDFLTAENAEITKRGTWI
jgi:hypothetical protein